MRSPAHRHEGSWEGDIPLCPLKVAVIREEFVALTGDPFVAVVLNQLLYWTQRVKDFDLLLEEERSVNGDCNVLPRHGWIYKTADDLIKETMLRVSRSTMRRYLNFLMEKEWVDERTNPHNRWDKTTQYRLNLKKLQSDLLALGYHLPGFSLKEMPPFVKENRPNALKAAETSKFHFETSKFQNETSNVQNCSFIYLNRDYPENTNRDRTQRACELQKISVQKNAHQKKEHIPKEPVVGESELESIFEKAVELWKKHVGQEVVFLTVGRKRQLKLLLNQYLKNDLQEWEKFCERVKASPFLMGSGANKWRVTFDWILSKDNFLKILEGNFETSEEPQPKEEGHLSRGEERRKILESIEDPIWKEWCMQLSRDSLLNGGSQQNNQISLFELKDIVKARFIEFDGKLVWIKSADQQSLNRIEKVRLKFLSIMQRTYPKARNIRVQIEGKGGEKATSILCKSFSYTTHDPRVLLQKTARAHPPFMPHIPNLRRGELHVE